MIETVTLKTVIVATMPRSGSNLVCSYMRTLGVVGRPDEYFNPEVAKRLTGEERTFQERAENALFFGRTRNGVVALKLFKNELDTVAGEIDFEATFPNRIWLWVRRRDMAAQAVSLFIAEHTQQWLSFHDARGKLPPFSEIPLRKRLEFLMGQDDAWQQYFTANDITPLVVWYEDFVMETDGALADICRHVGVPAPSFLPRVVRKLAAIVGIRLRGETDLKMKIQRTALNEEYKRRLIVNPNVSFPKARSASQGLE